MKEKFSDDDCVSPLEGFEQVLKILYEFHLDERFEDIKGGVRMKKDKKWFIKELLEDEVDDYDNHYNGGYEDGLAYALKLAHQLDEPVKVVIPQFVADWWERDDDSVTMYGRLRVERKHKFDLISIFYDKGLGDYLSKVEDWIYENDSAFFDLVNGKPYEVEKEPLYYAKLKVATLPNWNNDGEDFFATLNDSSGGAVFLIERYERKGLIKTLSEWNQLGIDETIAVFIPVEVAE